MIAFEPNPVNIGSLERHVRLNELWNVDIVKAAVSDMQGKPSIDPIDSRAGRLSGGLGVSGSIKVRVVRLDGMVRSGLPTPHYIEMNIEGGELDALQGVRQLPMENPFEIFVATYGDKTRQQCRELLNELGYAVVPI